MWVFVFESRIFNLLYHPQLRQQLEENSELRRRVADLQEKLREQKQRTREHEEALRSAGGAGKSGETPSVEASAQIDSKVNQKECVLVCCLMSVHTFSCMWNSGFSPCLPPSPSLISLSSFAYSPPSFLSSPCLFLLSPVLVFPLLPSSSSSISPLPSSPLPPSSPSFPPLLLPTYTAPLC